MAVRVVLALALCGLSTAVVIPWQQFGHDPARTANSHLAIPVDGSVMWVNDDKGALVEGGAAVGPTELVYYGTSGGDLMCVNAETGKTIWSRNTGGGIHATPAISNDGASVFIANVAGYIAEYDYLSGKTKNERYLGGRFQTNILITPQDMLYLTSVEGVLYCLNATLLSNVWVSDIEGADGSPALLEGMIFVASEARKELLAFDMMTGDFKYGKTIPGPSNGQLCDVAACPVEYWGGNGALAICNENVLSVWEPKDGTQSFNITIGQNDNTMKGSPVAFGDDGTMYWGTPDGTAHAIESHGTFGKVLWNYTMTGAVLATPAIGPGEVYFVSIHGDLRALDTNDGSLNWHLSLYPGITAPPSLNDNGLMFIGAFDGTMTAIGKFNPAPGSPSPTPSPHPRSSHGGGLKPGAAAAVAISVLVVVGLAGFFGYRRYQEHTGGSVAKAGIFSSGTAPTSYSTMTNDGL